MTAVLAPPVAPPSCGSPPLPRCVWTWCDSRGPLRPGGSMGGWWHDTCLHEAHMGGLD